jgi:hypothetical protein
MIRDLVVLAAVLVVLLGLSAMLTLCGLALRVALRRARPSPSFPPESAPTDLCPCAGGRDPACAWCRRASPPVTVVRSRAGRLFAIAE